MHAGHRMEAAVAVSPLTVLVRGVLEWTFPPGVFAALFADHAVGKWTRKLTIDAIVWLMVQVVSGARPSVFAAFTADQDSATPTLTASYQALYAKLGRLDLAFSTAVVRQSAERLYPLLQAAGCTRCPGWAGYRVRILDGTDLAGTEHRLAVLRKIKAAGLPGRFVVEYDLATGLVVDVVASEDAYTSERVLVDGIVQRTQAKDLCVADRHYCTTNFMFAVAARHAFFVVREHKKLRCRARRKARYIGRVATGEVWEQPLEVEDTETGERRKFRRIILKLDTPTREGETEIRLVTNLRPHVCALRIATLYRKRWTLERHFDFLKNCLFGEIEGLGKPRAAIFAMSMALVAGNAVAVVKQALKTSHGEEEFEKLSGYYLADEIAGNYRAIDKLILQRMWEQLARQAVQEFWQWCVRLAAQVRTEGLHTHPRGPKNPTKPKRLSGKRRHHYSTYRLQEEAKLKNAKKLKC
jgi:DDE family transposase